MKFFKKDKDNNRSFDFSEYHSEFTFILLLCAPLSIFIGWLIVKVFKLGSYENGKPTGDVFTNLGVYGDFLGGSTLPFLTLVTIAYVYKTFKLQEEQLRTQKEEMEETRATLREQNKTSQLQRFENSFFIQLKDLKDKEKKETYNGQGIRQPLDFAIIIDSDTLIAKMNTHVKINWEASRDTKWRFYKDEMQYWFDSKDLIFSNSDFQNYIFSIMRCFQLLNRYKGIMDDDEVRYYLRYIIDEIGEESYRLSMLYIIVFSKRYADFFKAIKDLKLHRFVTLDEFDTKLPSSLIFLHIAIERPTRLS